MRRQQENNLFMQARQLSSILDNQERKNFDYSRRGDFDNNMQPGKLRYGWIRFERVTNPTFLHLVLFCTDMGPNEGGGGGNQVSVRVWDPTRTSPPLHGGIVGMFLIVCPGTRWIWWFNSWSIQKRASSGHSLSLTHAVSLVGLPASVSYIVHRVCVEWSAPSERVFIAEVAQQFERAPSEIPFNPLSSNEWTHWLHTQISVQPSNMSSHHHQFVEPSTSTLHTNLWPETSLDLWIATIPPIPWIVVLARRPDTISLDMIYMQQGERKDVCCSCGPFGDDAQRSVGS